MSDLVKDILSLPKDVIFQILLTLKPEEVRILCRSQNPKVSSICQSNYFKETYRAKYGPGAI